MDIKALSDRRVQALSDEFASRLQREMRQFEQKEVQLHKDYQFNMANLQDALQKLKHANLTQYHENQEKNQNYEVVANDTKFKLDSLAK